MGFTTPAALLLLITLPLVAWLVWRKGGFASARWPLGIFLVQLALNTLWSFLFFAQQSPGLAAIEIVVLWLAIAATAIAFWRHSLVAALLLVPYFAWVTYAAALNIAIVRLNS